MILGFSQGGAVALYASLKSKLTLGGLVILSSYLPFAKLDFSSSSYTDVINMPIFWGHGEADPLIPIKWGKQSSERLSALGANVNFKSYKNMEHSASAQELQDVHAFLQTLFS
jgi:phospholipase/carboxylesterase